jgi:hypothetical protein
VAGALGALAFTVALGAAAGTVPEAAMTGDVAAVKSLLKGGAERHGEGKSAERAGHKSRSQLSHVHLLTKLHHVPPNRSVRSASVGLSFLAPLRGAGAGVADA